jgi:hypothetical protein
VLLGLVSSFRLPWLDLSCNSVAPEKLMPRRTDNQERAYSFLKDRFETQSRFTKTEFKVATGFSDGAFGAYLSKQFQGLLLPAGEGYYRVSGIFRLFKSWQEFRDKVVSQKRNFGRRYQHIPCSEVIIFEFYLPLRNEEFLKEALDALFYRDSILLRLRGVDIEDVRGNCPFGTLTNSELLREVCDFCSAKFGGYSISHVSGRFRAGPLRSRNDVFNASVSAPERYIVDETTAVVKFIIPCNENRQFGSSSLHESDIIRWLFEKLFISSIQEVVNAEDEIWVLESGLRNQLHIWRAKT